jgi:hypothetical protein
MKLKAYQSNDHFPRRIKAYTQGKHTSTILCDGCVQFTHADHDYSPKELQQLALIAENFRLFYDNIGGESEIVNPQSEIQCSTQSESK